MSGSLELRGLRRSYEGRAALDGLSVSVPAGQVFGFLGPNGATTVTGASLDGALALAGGLVGRSGAATTPSPAPNLPIRGLSPPLTDLSVRLTGLGVAIVIYMIILVYGGRITVGVSEESPAASSRSCWRSCAPRNS